MPWLPFAALMVIFSVLMVPVLFSYGIAGRHVIRSLKLRKAEHREGRIVYTNRVGGLIDQHPYVVLSVVIGVTVVVVLIWTLLELK